MTFSSAVFLFFFLPVSLLLYYFPFNRWRNATLIILSVFFYAWAEKEFVSVLALLILINALIGRRIEAAVHTQAANKGGGLLLLAGVVFNIGVLCLFKYTSFIVDNWNAAAGWLGMPPAAIPGIHAPVGISFLTFHAISCLVDIHRLRGKAPGLGEFALYLSFFPKILAGPILSYGDGREQLTDRPCGNILFLEGIERFITGFAKKILLANPLASAADRLFAIPVSALTLETAWLGIFCYSLQIYCDFSGYTDMAIGLGRMFGFKLPENFNYPYISQSVQEFWRRWHMSLSNWLRDYLYIPLGGSRCSRGRQVGNILVVFLVCGLWHGASWNFVLWGLWYGVFLGLERAGLGRVLMTVWRPLRHLYLLGVVVFGWVFFRSETLGHALGFFQALLGMGQGTGLDYPFSLYVDGELILCLVLGALISLPLARRGREFLLSEPSSAGRRSAALSMGLSAVHVFFLGVLFLLACMSLAGGTHKAFIYFKF